MQAIIGTYYNNEKLALKALKKDKVIVRQGKSWIIISKRQADELNIKKYEPN